ncbi:MAG TPA: M64 family metallopeptidase [Polyangiaceae bacterium]|nr:M64 family metallopeptidase [Polyangiaceae bacterium]
MGAINRTLALVLLGCVACSSEDGAPGTGTGGSSNTQAGSGTALPTAGASTAGGTASAGGTSNAAAGSSAGQSTSGGSAPTAGTSAGGTAGTGGTSFVPGGGTGGGAAIPPLDCGTEGWAVENHGNPKNRVNYLILADGYTAATAETTLKTHIQNAFKRRFEHESGEPYGRYRNFVNICVMKAVSQSDGIGNGPTAFDGGNGGDRLAAVNEDKVNAYIKSKVPATFEVDWKAVVLNQDKWENTGSYLMLWSGGGNDAPGAALHEGGHGFHQLADEYGSQTGCQNQKASCGSSGQVYPEVNSAGNCTTTDGKWDLWLGTTQKGLKVPDMGATGMQGTWQGSRYVGDGQYRPSCNSMMNSLFGSNVDTSFNSVSREQMIFSIWRAVTPIDSTEPPEGAANNPATLKVNVIDPAVINVDWTIDGQTTVNGGPSFSTAALASGTHMVSAKAYDNASMDLVKQRSGKCPDAVKGNYCHATSWPRSTQTVTWTVTKP